MPPRGVIRTVGRGAVLRAYAVCEDGHRMEVEHSAAKSDGKENIHCQTQSQTHQQGGPVKSEQGKQADKAPTPCAQITAQCGGADGCASTGARRDPAAAVRTLRGGNRRKRQRFTPVLPVIYEDVILV
jgi:hypothetical protein